MKTVKRNRYYCDFCGKGNGQAAAMKKHELRCTKNPNRECGVCKLLEQNPPAVAQMLALLPDETQYRQSWEGAPPDTFHYSSQLQVDVDAALPELKKLTSGCPACLMAAFRQANIPFVMSGVDFKKELDDIWNKFWTEKNAEHEAYY